MKSRNITKNQTQISEEVVSLYQDYHFKLSNFDGPLDLLLALVKEKKIDILSINLVEVAAAYLAIINQLKETEIDLAGDYLVMAAKLLQLKAKMLIEEPSEKLEAEIEVEQSQLIQQLIEYQQFKEIKDTLRLFETERQSIYIKTPSDISEFIQGADPAELDGHSNPVKLIMVMRKMFERVYAQRLRQTKLETNNISPTQKMQEIKAMLNKKSELCFEEVFSVPSIKHFVVTLIALLDLARQQILSINQNEQFGTITITKGSCDEK